jgi:hypothetical protein
MEPPGRALTDDDALIALARDTIDRNTDGRMYGGINLSRFTGGPCAELIAVGHARASGAREPSTIVAVGSEGGAPSAPADGTVRCTSTTTTPAPGCSSPQVTVCAVSPSRT